MNGDDSFVDLPWHDAAISSVEIDRRDPGHRDEVVVHVTWPDSMTSRIRRETWASVGIEVLGGTILDVPERWLVVAP